MAMTNLSRFEMPEEEERNLWFFISGLKRACGFGGYEKSRYAKRKRAGTVIIICSMPDSSNIACMYQADSLVMRRTRRVMRNVDKRLIGYRSFVRYKT